MGEFGLFIVLEGIDGSGKTEQSRRLTDWVAAQGREVVQTREPTEGTWGRRCRSWLRGETEAEPEEVARYFIEDRKEHVASTIRPAVARGAVVICDRYAASTLAYQAAQGLDGRELRERMAVEHFPEPDLVLWLRLPVEQALERLGPEASERFERRAFLARVDREYEALGLSPVAAGGTRDEVEGVLRERIARLLDRV